MCKGTCNWEDVYIIRKELIPIELLETYNVPRINNYGGIPVDLCIGEEVEGLIKNGIRTVGSCCGHGTEESHALVYKEELDKVEKLGYTHREFRWDMHYVFLNTGTQIKEKYTWRFCEKCHQRIFKDEVEGDTIETVNEKLYCIDCAVIIETGDIYYEGCD